jgi:hypothetical protein
LFRSENNAAGGYACPRAVGGPDVITPSMYYYVGSILPVEWTEQHGCGNNPNVRCEIVLQYMCGANVRDGTPRDVNDAATDTIPDDDNGPTDFRFGMHESRDNYFKCKTRERNRGLFTADRKLAGYSARFTRQNNNGERYGYECNEESEYYPYWHPSEWKDIAVFTDDISRCPYFEQNSQNVAAKGECQYVNGPAVGTGPRASKWYNNQRECETPDLQRNDVQFIQSGKTLTQKWVTKTWGIAKPDCGVLPLSRSNHLGNVGSTPQSKSTSKYTHTSVAHRYEWKIPDDVNEKCVLRLRYNISSTDIPLFANSSDNGALKQDPFVFFDALDANQDQSKNFLSLALNTNQVFRTFQDRSYTFSIKSRPSTIPSTARIMNLNVRGKRGNIVQTFPAVEYDFVPNNLTVVVNDYVHFQWTGSDYNPRRGCNNGEGGPPDRADNNPEQNSRADRSNLIEQSDNRQNFPRDAASLVASSMFDDRATILKLALLGQNPPGGCITLPILKLLQNQATRENNINNCAKLNGAPTPYFDAGPIQLKKAGTFPYYCSRNNNFSNRDQKGVIRVVPTGSAMVISRSVPLITPGRRPNIVSISPPKRAVPYEGIPWTSSVFSLVDKAMEVMGVRQSVIENPDTSDGAANPNTRYVLIDKYGMPATPNSEVDNDNQGDGQLVACGYASTAKPLSLGVVLSAIGLTFFIMTLFA